MACLITTGCALFLSSSSTLEVSIVQYGVSVILDGVVFLSEMGCRLLGWLSGGVRAISAYDGVVLAAAWDWVSDR